MIESVNMEIVTTPMCEKILEFAGISEYKVNKDPDKEQGDLAIILSESKVKMNSLNIKLNTFSQIKDSIIEVYRLKCDEPSCNYPISEEEIEYIFSQYSIANKWVSNEKKELQDKNYRIKVKVYSKFLQDIVEDMGFNIVSDDQSNFDYMVLPDYMNIENIGDTEGTGNIKNIGDTENIENIGDTEDTGDIDSNYNNYRIVSIPTHKNVSKDPIKRAELRYSILSNLKSNVENLV